MMMAGSKELKCASETWSKVRRARFQEALMRPPPQKCLLRTVPLPRGSTYQGKLSSSVLTTMLSAGLLQTSEDKYLGGGYDILSPHGTERLECLPL